MKSELSERKWEELLKMCKSVVWTAHLHLQKAPEKHDIRIPAHL